MSTTFDLVAVGSGTAASTAAFMCAKAGWSVAVVDSRPFGGTCALRGCDPKKVLLGGAEAVDFLRRMRGHGVSGEAFIHWSELLDFKRSFTEPVPGERQEGFRKAGITTFRGRARFVDEETVAVDGEHLHAGNVLLANGAMPAPLPFEGADLLLDSAGFLDLDALPDRIVFVGGGYITMEFAHLALRAGCKVTIVQSAARPLVKFDPDLVDRLSDTTRRLGADLHVGTRVTRIERRSGGIVLTGESDGGAFRVEADLAVHGAGRVPELDDMDLERANVTRTERGVRVNEYLQSISNPRVYAAGDAADTPGMPLTPVAGMESRVAASNLLEGNHRKPDYRAVPSVAFTEPPIALVGLTEHEAVVSGLAVDVRHGDMSDWFTYRRVGARAAAYKIVVDRDRDVVVGAHLLGSGADELINLFALAIRCEIAVGDLKDTLFAYPTHASDAAHMLRS